MPRTVREWTLTDEIGRGGMGVVYRATHKFLHGDWAVKVIRPELSEDVESRQRFMSEVMVLSRLHHEHIIEIQTPFEEGGQLFLPMEFLSGQSLESVLKAEGGPWRADRAVNVISQAAAGLGFAHRQSPSILHRDIKPGNIQVLDGGRVKVLDFGLARTLGDKSMTATGKAVGTPAYMAPEVLDGKKATERSDVYSLGVVLYRLLAGRLPFDMPEEDSSIHAVFMAVARGIERGLPDVREFAPQTPPALAELTMRTLSRRPEDRPADGAELAGLLGRLSLADSAQFGAQGGVGEGADLTRLSIDLTSLSAKKSNAPSQPSDYPDRPSVQHTASSSAPAKFEDSDRSLIGLETFVSPKNAVPEPVKGVRASYRAILSALLVISLLGISAAVWWFGKELPRRNDLAMLDGSATQGATDDQVDDGRSTGSDSDEVIEFTMHIMSQCPFGAQVQKGIAPVLAKLGPAIKFKMHFIGDEAVPGVLTSMHGDSEVQGDKFELCTVKYAPERYMDVIVCMANDMRNIPANFEKCATDARVDPAPIKACAEGQEGTDLVSASFRASKEKEARGSPTMFVNGEKYAGGRTDMEFLRSICNAYKTRKPEACRDIPAPKKIPVIVLSDKRCKKCEPDKILGQLKNIFPGLEASTLDYNYPEGRKLYDDLKDKGVKLLPAFLFDPVMAEDPGFQQVKRFVVDAGPYKLLQVGAKFDPTAEICDNLVDDDGDTKVDCIDEDCAGKVECRQAIDKRLDLFVMSQCPFGVKALNSMVEVLDAFKNDGIEFRINYIAEKLPDGTFKALHGQPEVDENIRELCAIKYYNSDYKYMDYITCRNKDIRSSNWRSCAVNGIDAKVISQCAGSNEGKQLLSANIKIANELEIGASPTWLANNQNKFSGVAAEQIKKQFCDFNKNLRGCSRKLSD